MRSIPASKAAPGSYRVSGVLLPPDVTTRLGDLGLRPGIVVTLLQNQGSGGTLVACGDARVALDADTAARVRLVTLEGEAS